MVTQPKKRASWLPVYAAALVALATGCQPQTPPDTREADTRALRETDAAFAKAAGAKDLERSVAFYADEAIMLEPNAPMASGRVAVRKAFGDLLAIPGFAITWQTTKVDVARSGDLGYTLGTYQMTLNGPKGKPTTDHGKYVTVWKKQADGTWKAVADMFSSDQPAPTGTR
jgi:ketosteroid isomerase-like protein